MKKPPAMNNPVVPKPDEEYLPPTYTTAAKEPANLSEMAKALMADPEYLEAVKQRMKDGTASVFEQRTMMELSALEPKNDDSRERMRKQVAMMSKFEIRLLAQALTRRPENCNADHHAIGQCGCRTPEEMAQARVRQKLNLPEVDRSNTPAW